jgi:hypothetical protein
LRKVITDQEQRGDRFGPTVAPDALEGSLCAAAAYASAVAVYEKKIEFPYHQCVDSLEYAKHARAIIHLAACSVRGERRSTGPTSPAGRRKRVLVDD